jgi:RimJ/RimL family protein N-acetyltransferase/2-polyprenyl-3-methyl-5-hydroxy-6-metoxy-1,4-benzoquinol methylase
MALAKEFGVGDTPPELFKDYDEFKSTNGTYILLNNLDQPVGYSQFGVTYNRTAWFSLFIDPQAQGNGYGKSAFSVITDKLFKEHSIKNILHAAMIANCKMIKIIEDFGCRRVGEIRQRALTMDNSKNRVNTSCVQYEITFEDYNNKINKFQQDSRLSYGIQDKSFLDYEKKRLLTQNKIQIGPLENQIIELISKGSHQVIMDLGCGLGNLVNGLSVKFPEIQFIGIDNEPEFIKLANESRVNNNVKFIETSIFENIEDFNKVDIFLMRIVAQHIGPKGLNLFFQKFKKYAKPSAKLLIIDIDDNSWCLKPNIAGFDILLDSCNYNQSKFGGDRQIGSKCKDLAKEQGLKIEHFQICPFDSYNIGISSFSEIIEALFKYKADNTYLEERDIQTIQLNFNEWKQNKSAFGYGCLFLTQVGKYE